PSTGQLLRHLGYSLMLLECEMELRNKAILQQKRRLKQATQFVHKDSADLLPLDGLTRLGTSKDLQPHSVVQRRLLEGNLNKLRGEARGQSARPLLSVTELWQEIGFRLPVHLNQRGELVPFGDLLDYSAVFIRNGAQPQRSLFILLTPEKR
uniref:Uncharacterized protein n=1 Tax=Serinus canaria TaxID=9135 RepID=A0A8C9NRA6_SERCA